MVPIAIGIGCEASMKHQAEAICPCEDDRLVWDCLARVSADCFGFGDTSLALAMTRAIANARRYVAPAGWQPVE